MGKPYTPNDKWSRRAAEAGYRARSVFKLEELDKRFRLLKQGQTVLDLGAAPGSWLQYAAERVGPKGKVIGLDLQEIEPIEGNVITAVQDITDIASVQAYLQSNDVDTVDIVISDLAPKTTGIRDVDQWHSIELSQAVIDVAAACLRHGGYCVMKVLRGADFDEFLRDTRRDWKLIKATTVKASRDSSKEVYVILKRP